MKDQVGVLFDVARLAQVEEHRPFVGPAFVRPVELRKRDDRHFRFAGSFEATADLPDLLGTRLAIGHPSASSQVVDDDREGLRFFAGPCPHAGGSPAHQSPPCARRSSSPRSEVTSTNRGTLARAFSDLLIFFQGPVAPLNLAFRRMSP